MDIIKILQLPPNEIVDNLTQKTISIPKWDYLRREYDSELHPVMNKAIYPDVVRSSNEIEQVTRVTLDFQRLAVKRMTELCFGIPVKRVASSDNQTQKDISTIIEAIFMRNRIDNVNIERANLLFSGCEVLTLWYAKEDRNTIYGIDSPIKIRCKNFSPVYNDELYPFFDEYGDMVAMSVKYKRKRLDETITLFDCYTADRHIKLEQGEKTDWQIVEDEKISLGKIPAVYCYRPTPVWENTSKLVYEMEWTLSRNGNYIRKNSKPLFGIFADENIELNKELTENQEFRSILQFPMGSSAQYITWQQSIESIKFQIDELKQMFFTQLQLPDFSFESMKSTPMSGEARKQLFIDAQLKVKDESGRLLEMLDREVNVVKQFVKLMLPQYANEIDALQIENRITPFTITDESDKITNYVTATGGKAIMSQIQAIRELGLSSDPDRTLQEIQEDSAQSAAELTI